MIEANLIVSLTFPITPSRLPSVSSNGNKFVLPTIEISVANKSANTVRHPDDLTLFGGAVDEALKLLQDIWKVRKVHLYVGAPTTAVLTIGQKMQARHHASFVCHETSGGPESAFAPTIEISNETVRNVTSGQTVSLQP